MNRLLQVKPKTGREIIDLSKDRDTQLIVEIGAGSEVAFGEIYQKYHRQIYSYILRLLDDPNGADDVLQEVFLAVWQGAKHFRQKSSLKTWIYRIAHKQAISWLRRHFHKENSLDHDDLLIGLNNPENTAIINIENNLLSQAIAQLPVKHRSVLELAFGMDMSYSEIAEILNCPVGTVKSRMSYALRSLNNVLTEQGIDSSASIRETE